MRHLQWGSVRSTAHIAPKATLRNRCEEASYLHYNEEVRKRDLLQRVVSGHFLSYRKRLLASSVNDITAGVLRLSLQATKNSRNLSGTTNSMYFCTRTYRSQRV